MSFKDGPKSRTNSLSSGLKKTTTESTTSLLSREFTYMYLLILNIVTYLVILRLSAERCCFWGVFSLYKIQCHDKTNKMACAPSEDSDQPGHPPSLIRVFAVRMKKAWVLSYLLSAQRRLSSDWSHSHCVGFVMRRLI